MNRLVLLAAAFGLAFAPVTVAKEARPYPHKTIKLIVPAALGSPPDIIGRLLSDKLSAALGQAIIVENRQGATGTIGLHGVAQAAPDGYTLGIMAMPSVVMAHLVKSLPYDTEKDFAPIALISWHYSLLAVSASSGIYSVSDLIATAKANPGAIKFSSSGNATPAHLAAELFKRDANVDMTHVPYKGSQAGAVALLTGDVDLNIGPVRVLSPHIKSGKLRALATTAPRRMAPYPDLPTFVELGYPSVRVEDWQGIVAPAGTPKEVITALYTEIARISATPDVMKQLEAAGMPTAIAGPEDFALHIHSEMQRWGDFVRDKRLKLD